MLGGLRLLGGASSTHSQSCECALSTLRVRTLGPASTHSQARTYIREVMKVY